MEYDVWIINVNMQYLNIFNEMIYKKNGSQGGNGKSAKLSAIIEKSCLCNVYNLKKKKLENALGID